MKIDNVLVLDDVLTNSQCDQLIEEGTQDLDSSLLHTYLNYRHKQFELDHPIIEELSYYLLDKYAEAFPAINYTSTTTELIDWRFKHFPPGYSFSSWHQEHDWEFSHRIACMIVYLSDHNCGTEFLATGETVLSKKGRAMIFPTFWTHTHRGQLCPEKKDRYLMNAYLFLTHNRK